MWETSCFMACVGKLLFWILHYSSSVSKLWLFASLFLIEVHCLFIFSVVGILVFAQTFLGACKFHLFVVWRDLFSLIFHIFILPFSSEKRPSLERRPRDKTLLKFYTQLALQLGLWKKNLFCDFFSQWEKKIKRIHYVGFQMVELQETKLKLSLLTTVMELFCVLQISRNWSGVCTSLTN